MTTEWNGDAALRAIREAAAQRLLAAAIHLQSAHRMRLNVSNPRPYRTPAPRGEYPRKRTGIGQAGVLVVPTDPGQVARDGRVRVGHSQSAAYLAYLAGRGWKGLLDTLAAETPRLRQILGG